MLVSVSTVSVAVCSVLSSFHKLWNGIFSPFAYPSSKQYFVRPYMHVIITPNRRWMEQYVENACAIYYINITFIHILWREKRYRHFHSMACVCMCLIVFASIVIYTHCVLHYALLSLCCTICHCINGTLIPCTHRTHGYSTFLILYCVVCVCVFFPLYLSSFKMFICCRVQKIIWIK